MNPSRAAGRRGSGGGLLLAHNAKANNDATGSAARATMRIDARRVTDTMTQGTRRTGFFVVILMTPFMPRIPYIPASAPLSTLIDSML